MKTGMIFSISISPENGKTKKEVPEAAVLEYGIENDGFPEEWGRQWGRQVSCLDLTSVLHAKAEKTTRDAVPGEFGENIIIDGIDLYELTVGDQMRLGESVILEVTQIGMEQGLYRAPKVFGTNLLAYEGVFCKVVQKGKIKKGDPVFVEELKRSAEI